ncbi:MAG: YggS family pyridoxal phosphate-dependent enzyme [Pseudonocardiaceae bacterium]|nr:YggS family pyridoxal phosphate-dependent enzyme [Pseudonocardiaceae bacterium]
MRDRIGRACARADRDPSEVRLLAVTKTFPAEDVALLTDLGVTDLAENKDQEAAAKAARLAELRPAARPRWHMVGQLQRNKSRSVARWAHEVQSVDSARLATALQKAVHAAREAGERSDPLDVLVQVSLDDDPARGGCRTDDLPELTAGLARSGDLCFRGLMAIAPLGVSPEPAFERFAEVAARIRADYPKATEMSAGMSGDLDEAIAHGSTCVRVGTALLGRRRLTSG